MKKLSDDDLTKIFRTIYKNYYSDFYDPAEIEIHRCGYNLITVKCSGIPLCTLMIMNNEIRMISDNPRIMRVITENDIDAILNRLV